MNELFKDRQACVLAGLGGLFASIEGTTVCRLLEEPLTTYWFFSAFVVYFATGVSVSSCPPKLAVLSLIMMYLAIPFGISLDSVVDYLVGQQNRNMFPFEIIIHYAFVWAPGILGIGLAMAFRRIFTPSG